MNKKRNDIIILIIIKILLYEKTDMSNNLYHPHDNVCCILNLFSRSVIVSHSQYSKRQLEVRLTA